MSRRRSSRIGAAIIGAVIIGAAGTGCGDPGRAASASSDDASPATSTVTAPPTSAEVAPVATPETFDARLGPITPRPTPTTVRLGEGRSWPVVAVGVDDRDAVDVPPSATEVGWYRHGSAPGESGSTVLVGHVDFDRRRGPFFDLGAVAVGSSVAIERSDATQVTYVVETVTEFAKTSLPTTDLFSRDGDERLVIISCGGEFDPVTRSYESNIVVIATPA